MRILVLFKIVPDLDLLQDKEWTIKNTLPVETAYVKKIINVYDESALELTLKMADHSINNEQQIELSALTIGEPHADLFLKKLLALGFNNTYRVQCSADLRFNPYAIAYIITAFASQYGPYDLIAMGMQSSDGDNAKTALLVAEMLTWPCITGVTGFELRDLDLVAVRNINDQGLVEQLVHEPAVLAVGNAPCSLLRVPTLRDIKSAADQEIAIISLQSLGCDLKKLNRQNDTELESLNTVNNTRAGLVIEGTSAEEKARLLYEKHLKGWLSSR